MSVDLIIDPELLESIATIWQRAADDWGSVCREYMTQETLDEEDGHITRVQQWLRENGVVFVSKKDGSVV